MSQDARVEALNYVADMTWCGTDAEWHFKPGYDPQIVLDALAAADRLAPDTASSDLADELQKLCCAETEGEFFDCVTDNIQTILAALRGTNR